MRVEDQQAIKWSSFWLILCDAVIVIIAIWLFWDTVGDGTSAGAYFVLIIVGLFFYAIKVLYYVQCFQQDKRMTHSWNRSMEWIPIFNMVVDILIIQSLFFVFILFKSNINITEAFSNLGIEGWWLLIILLVAVALILWFSIRSCYIHRSNSVTLCKTIDDVAHAQLRGDCAVPPPPPPKDAYYYRSGGGISPPSQGVPL